MTDIKTLPLVILKHATTNWMGWDRYEGCPYVLTADWDNNIGGYKTGMTDKEQSDLEIKLRLAKDTLNPRNEPFWIDWSFIIRGPENARLNLNNPDHLLAFYVLKGSKFVANSKAELLQKPDADFYMENTREEIEEETKLGELKGQVYKAIAGLAPQDHRKMLQIFGERVEGMPIEQATALLYSKVDFKAKETRDIKERLQKILEILTMEKSKLNVYSTIFSAIDCNIIIKFKNEFMLEDTPLGTSAGEVYKFFQTPEGQKFRAIVDQRLEARFTKKVEATA